MTADQFNLQQGRAKARPFLFNRRRLAAGLSFASGIPME